MRQKSTLQKGTVAVKKTFPKLVHRSPFERRSYTDAKASCGTPYFHVTTLLLSVCLYNYMIITIAELERV